MGNKQQDLLVVSNDRNNSWQHPVPCIFMDRDGVIIEDTHFVSDPKKVVLCRGAKSFLERQGVLNNKVVIVTNQSGIGRKMFTWHEYHNVTNTMLELLGHQVKIDAIYANSLLPKEFNGVSSWRKPGIGMLLAAEQDLKVDVKRSIFIGDRVTDMLAGWVAGVDRLIMITNKNEWNIEVELQQVITQAPRGYASTLASEIVKKVEIHNCLSKVITQRLYETNIK